jgi:hypothetical protein
LSPWLKARLMAQPLLEETRTAMGKARNSLDPKKPQFSQVELCEVAGIPMATANNWILTGALRPADVGSRRARKPRLFSVVTIYEAKVTGDLVKWLGTPPPTAAGMARKSTDGCNWCMLNKYHLSKQSFIIVLRDPFCRKIHFLFTFRIDRSSPE